MSFFESNYKLIHQRKWGFDGTGTPATVREQANGATTVSYDSDGRGAAVLSTNSSIGESFGLDIGPVIDSSEIGDLDAVSFNTTIKLNADAAVPGDAGIFIGFRGPSDNIKADRIINNSSTSPRSTVNIANNSSSNVYDTRKVLAEMPNYVTIQVLWDIDDDLIYTRTQDVLGTSINDNSLDSTVNYDLTFEMVSRNNSNNKEMRIIDAKTRYWREG